MTVTNRMLQDLVAELGFTKGESTDRGNRFWNHVDGITVVLPDNRSTHPATQADVFTLRGHLDNKGLLATDEFDRALGIRPAGAGTARRR